ncbi:hypothetical protein HC248_03499 [Polaromonas vacuolata]|uniref:SPOR domain-containing protein n=1 Tax=Polaromonas vacuolata TaxID=37448 RepID=A0A6H2HE56_9BURK|nr:SPOR domain-containing protein [Polaromonas vacuolata]QJC58162.1 hypothetical protein HC248_03499 [Polaromonas vacuolata]
MLRPLLLLLVLANLVFYAWRSGSLADISFAPVVESEPQRLSQQIDPDTLHILLPAEAAQLLQNVAHSNASQCLEAGVFSEAEAGVLRASLNAGVAPERWLIEPSTEPARWIIYMGKYDSAQTVAKKRTELRRLNIKAESVSNAQLEPGLSLGSFDSQASAEADLQRISKRGVNTAKVILAQPERSGQKLKLAAVDAQLQAQLDTLKLPLAGKTLKACR